MEYIISVKGMESAPQGSKKHVGNGIMVETSKRLKAWRNQVEFESKVDSGRYNQMNQLR